MATKNLRLTFKYKSNGCIKIRDPLLEDIVYHKNHRQKSAFAPTPEEKLTEKWKPYNKNPHVEISNYGGVRHPGNPKGYYPEPGPHGGWTRFAYIKPEAYERLPCRNVCTMRLPLEVCREHVPLPEGRTLYSRRTRDGNPLNPRADNMTFYTGYRNKMKQNPYYSYETVLNMIEKRKIMVDGLRRRGIDPFDGW